ncbi:MAG: TatD family hydrolase [Candidatus Auribacterota bacterium]|jgi:predicted metal-dependent TIM-barrel fold hydrolase|nr:TatD family hydrolase [Candidatus Auribacterota bacterium]
MRIIEPHIHMLARTTDDYQKMAVGGICAVVEPSFWLGHDRKYAESFFDYFDLLIEFESRRAEKYGMKHFTCIGLNPKEANNIDTALKVVEGMKRFLDRSTVVGIGEIGFDQITDAEEEMFRAQLRIARETGLPVVVHLPHNNKVEGTRRTLAALADERMDVNKVYVDHNTEDTIAMTYQAGYWAGMTLYPVTKMTPERAIEVLKQYGVERMMISSSADWGYSDPLLVPMTCYKLSQCNFVESDIRKLVYDNPCSFYSQCERFVI